MSRPLLFALLSLCSLPLQAAVVSRPLDYEVGGRKMQSVLVYDDAVKAPRPLRRKQKPLPLPLPRRWTPAKSSSPRTRWKP